MSARTRPGVALAGAVMALVAAAPAAQAAPGEARPFSWAGSCEQVATIVLADERRVRPYVAEGFDLAAVAGRVPLLVTGIACDSALGGGTPYPNDSGLIAVFTSHPDDPMAPPGHAYDLLWQQEDRAFARAFRRGGYETERARGLDYVGTRTGATFDATRSRVAPFSLTVDRVDRAVPPVPLTSHHWHAGERGRVEFVADHTNLELDPGAGHLTTPPGSLLARLLGSTEATGAGGILSFEFTAAAGPA